MREGRKGVRRAKYWVNRRPQTEKLDPRESDKGRGSNPFVCVIEMSVVAGSRVHLLMIIEVVVAELQLATW